MALRDPGAPRRNPLFAVDATVDPDGGPAGGIDGDAAPDASHDAPADDGWTDDHLPDAAGDPLLGAPGGAVGPLLGALYEAGPEAAEHLVNAAHELTLAVKVVVDAFERTLAEQRAVFAAEGEEAADGDDDPFAGAPGSRTPEPRMRAPRVQNIDVE